MEELLYEAKGLVSRLLNGRADQGFRPLPHVGLALMRPLTVIQLVEAAIRSRKLSERRLRLALLAAYLDHTTYLLRQRWRTRGERYNKARTCFRRLH